MLDMKINKDILNRSLSCFALLAMTGEGEGGRGL